jgi:lysophospholipase L1-like esterase
MNIIRVLIVFSLLLLSACQDELTLEPLSDRGVILAFGDSLTTGKGVRPVNSYPQVLSTLSGKKVVNAGISGEQTRAGLRRLPDVLRDNPEVELMLLLEGGNDILNSVNLKQTHKNLSKMIVLAKEKNIQVVLVGVPKRSIFLKSAGFYQKLADKHKLLYLPDLIPDLLSDETYKSDLIHFNKLGYRLMAKTIYKRLQQSGALR